MADDLNYILFLFEIFHVIKLSSFFYGSIVLLQSYYRDYTDEHPFTIKLNLTKLNFRY